MVRREDEYVTGPRALQSVPPTPLRDGRVGAWSRRTLPTVCLVLAAFNLRPAVTSLGALLKEAREGLGMGGTLAGLLTSMPALCFALLGLAAPRLARRWGPATVVCAGLTAIAAGLALRPLMPGIPGFLLLSVLALAGIALGNVLMPVVVKRWFPDRVGPMTGLYSMAVAAGAGVASAVTVPLTGALGGGWRLGLGAWAVVALAAALPWAVVARRGAERPGPAPARHSTAHDPMAPAPAPDAPATPITRSPVAWALAVFFGLQASGAYVVMGWMPQIFRDGGVPASTAGVLAALTMTVGVPLSLVLPRIAVRMRHQGPLAVALAAFGLAGYAGLWLAPAAGAWAWALLLGVANSSFPLALTMIGMRARTGAGVARLSAFAQSVGYLLSIPGPLLVGGLYQRTGGWGAPIALLAALMVPQAVAGMLAGRDRAVEDGP
ncbi:MFS transporter [Streptomyces orinoci]|uniref:MFS transporter n=1 Tax=Streptomyces orinoci TaxID=67339 RepID=A0ABV3JWW2_STRON|nr:MFS transporter [Streptomyces orinoci]